MNYRKKLSLPNALLSQRLYCPYNELLEIEMRDVTHEVIAKLWPNKLLNYPFISLGGVESCFEPNPEADFITGEGNSMAIDGCRDTYIKEIQESTRKIWDLASNPLSQRAVLCLSPFSNFPTFPFRSRSQYIFAELDKLFNFLPKYDAEGMTYVDEECNNYAPCIVSCGFTGMIQYVFHVVQNRIEAEARRLSRANIFKPQTQVDGDDDFGDKLGPESGEGIGGTDEEGKGKNLYKIVGSNQDGWLSKVVFNPSLKHGMDLIAQSGDIVPGPGGLSIVNGDVEEDIENKVMEVSGGMGSDLVVCDVTSPDELDRPQLPNIRDPIETVRSEVPMMLAGIACAINTLKDSGSLVIVLNASFTQIVVDALFILNSSFHSLNIIDTFYCKKEDGQCCIVCQGLKKRNPKLARYLNVCAEKLHEEYATYKAGNLSTNSPTMIRHIVNPERYMNTNSFIEYVSESIKSLSRTRLFFQSLYWSIVTGEFGPLKRNYMEGVIDVSRVVQWYHKVLGIPELTPRVFDTKEFIYSRVKKPLLWKEPKSMNTVTSVRSVSMKSRPTDMAGNINVKEEGGRAVLIKGEQGIEQPTPKKLSLKEKLAMLGVSNSNTRRDTGTEPSAPDQKRNPLREDELRRLESVDKASQRAINARESARELLEEMDRKQLESDRYVNDGFVVDDEEYNVGGGGGGGVDGVTGRDGKLRRSRSAGGDDVQSPQPPINSRKLIRK